MDVCLSRWDETEVHSLLCAIMGWCGMIEDMELGVGVVGYGERRLYANRFCSSLRS